uniref:Uncharacterized protein n=1 Tax=Arundo donax TaxID=35708 RepID=A0A0A9AUT0_ARUDO
MGVQCTNCTNVGCSSAVPLPTSLTKN